MAEEAGGPELVLAAAEAREHAYAPYSDFVSGAAVRGRDGRIVTGVLVENIVFGAAMCAERTALFSSATEGIEPVALAVVAPRTGDDLTWPCGTCRQVALELGGPELVVVAATPDFDEQATASLGDLTTGFPRPHRWR